MSIPRTSPPVLENAAELLDESPCGFVHAVSDGSITWINATFLRWTAYTAEDLVNKKRFADLLTMAGKIFYETHVAPSKQLQGHIDELALDLKCADGREIPVLVSVIRKPYADGQTFFDRIVVFNATERRRYEKELLVARQSVEKTHQEAVLLNETLAKANDALREFAFVASHDLQAPLRTITMHLDLFLTRHGAGLEDKAKLLVTRAMSGAERMSALVQDLLLLSKSGLSVHRETFPLDELMADAVENLGGAIQESGAVVRHRGLPTVVADRSQLVLVLQNLVGNAIKYRAVDRALEVEVTAEETEAEWRVAVRDNGAGFDPARREEIFSAFRRLHGSEVAGTGIGLAICRKIVAAHGGRIWADSTPGVGSLFTFVLPRVKTL